MNRRERQAQLLPLLVMLAVTLAACGGNRPEVGPKTGQLVPEFTVRTSAGSSFSSRAHRGEIILLYFSFPG